MDCLDLWRYLVLVMTERIPCELLKTAVKLVEALLTGPDSSPNEWTYATRSRASLFWKGGCGVRLRTL